MNVGRKIFYDNINGNIILDKGEMQGGVVEETIDEIIPKFTALSERIRDTYDVLELPYGAYAQDFRECNGYRVNPTTKALEFSYPNPNEPQPELVYQPPLTEQVTDLKSQLAYALDAIDFLLMNVTEV